jgi:hypothetical protein
VLLVVLVPSWGIAGAGVALCGAYVVMLGVMYLLTRRVFAVAFEWRRLAQMTIILGGLTVAGDLLLPTHGLVGFLTRGVVVAAMPLALFATGFAHRQELRQARELYARARRSIASSAGTPG